MKKTILLILCALSALANEDLINQALEYERQGEYKKAMQIYKNLALKDTAKTKNLELSLNNEQNVIKEHKIDDFNPRSEALANYLGTEKSYNPFGIRHIILVILCLFLIVLAKEIIKALKLNFK